MKNLACIAAVISVLVSGCTAGAYHPKWQTTTTVDKDPAEAEYFKEMVHIVRKYMKKQPDEFTIKKVNFLLVMAKLKKECEGEKCHLAYANRKIVVTPDYIKLTIKENKMEIHIYDLDVAARSIYRL